MLGLIGVGITACSAGMAVAGPKSPAASETAGHIGYLRVFSSTEQRITGDETYFYPHTDYGIYNVAGKCVRWVRNGGPEDDRPATAALPEGAYVVLADSDFGGRIHVPIVIRTGRTTILHLEKSDWKPARNDKAIRLSSGQVIGYAAN